MSAVPTEVIFNGKTIPMLNFMQLEQMSRQHLKNASRNLMDSLGADNLPPITGHGQDLMIAWILDVQCAVCRGKGIELSPALFGAPAAANAEGFFGRGEGMPVSAKQQAARQGPAPDQWSHSKDVHRSRDPMTEQSSHEANSAYEAAMHGAALARQRNAGSNIFG